MRLKVYSIYDTAVGAYLRPFYARADGEAFRAFQKLALDSTHEVGQTPEDYQLFFLSVFDDNAGVFGFDEEGPVSRVCICTALEAIAQKEKSDAPVGNGT